MGRKKKNKSLKELLFVIGIAALMSFASYLGIIEIEPVNSNKILYNTSFDLSSIPEFKDEPYVVLNENNPDFSEEDLNRGLQGFEVMRNW